MEKRPRESDRSGEDGEGDGEFAGSAGTEGEQGPDIFSAGVAVPEGAVRDSDKPDSHQ